MHTKITVVLRLWLSIVLTGVRQVSSCLSGLKSKGILVSLLSLISICSPVYASSCLDTFYRKPKTKVKSEVPFKKFKSDLPGKPRVSLTRFEGFGSFASRYSGEFKVAEGPFAYTGNPIQSERVNFKDNETFLNELQKFPLGKMTETDYITAENATMFNYLGTSLQTSQVNFFEVTRAATREQWEAYPSELLKNRWDDMTTFHDSHTNGLASLRTAAFWSVGGQTLDPKTRVTNKVQLPWEKEEARRGQSLDRTKYKYVWEWGRAAQDIAGEIAPLYSGNAALNYIDLVTGGGELKDGYVMFHSFDRINTRYYLQEHPDSTYPPGDKNQNDMLFLVTLKDMLQRYPPSKFSKHVETIVRLSGSKISEIEALDILIDQRILRWDELNLTGRVQQDSPIIISDVSSGRLLGLKIMLMKFGLSEEQVIHLIDYLVALRPTLHAANTNSKYQHAADSLMTSFQYQRHNGIEISNLDPKLAARDPNYVKSVIFNTYMYYLHRFSKLIHETYDVSSTEAKQLAMKLLVDHGVVFGVTSAEAEVQKQNDKLNPSAQSSQPKTELLTYVDPKLLETHPYKHKDSKIYFYTLPQIMSWARENPSQFLNGDYEINPGHWRQHYFRSQVDIL